MTHVKYIDRTRDYYLSQGYDEPYRWAHFDDVPFTPLKKPLKECRITLVSTSEIAIRYDPETSRNPTEEGQVGSVYSIPTDTPPEALYRRSYAHDTHATNLDDVNAYFPVTRLLEAVESGRVRGITSRLHGVYNAYSQRKTAEQDAPEVLERCRAEGVDAALLVPI